MAIAAAAISVALAFANLDKLESFRAMFFEAKVNKAVNKAYAAIDQLKQVALDVTTPIVDEMAVSGRMLQFIPLKYKLERVQKIEETLKKLGASQEEIDEACSTIYNRLRQDHIYNILYALQKANPEKSDLFKGIDDHAMNIGNRAELENFIESNQLKKDQTVDEAILDLDYFLKNKKLRREDQWQS